jgi:hypothetical protein
MRSVRDNSVSMQMYMQRYKQREKLGTLCVDLPIMGELTQNFFIVVMLPKECWLLARLFQGHVRFMVLVALAVLKFLEPCNCVPNDKIC